jgi:hypothetical protein
MSFRNRSLAAGLAALGLLTAACGGGNGDQATPTAAPSSQASPSASPTAVVAFTTGTAHVALTGDLEEEFDATIDETDSTFDPGNGEHELLWTNAEGRALRLTITASGTTVEDAFVAIGAPGLSIDDELYFPDAFHANCTVKVTKAQPTTIAGSFTCKDLESADGTKTVDAEGTFSASV